jgi:hypothetical protein
MPARTAFGDLREPIPQLVSDLTRGRIGALSKCHLDPDIDPSALPMRHPDWRGAFGQLAQAQQHLANQKVEAGDLFLFWGLFREVERRNGRWSYVGRPIHAVFGWLQMEQIWSQAAAKPVLDDHPWLVDHPHAQDGWGRNNTIYIARRNLALGSVIDLPGFGVLQRPLVLTAADATSPSLWSVPGWLHPAVGGAGLTYHPPDRWLDDLRLRSAARGQEFVAAVTGRPDAIAWARAVIEQGLMKPCRRASVASDDVFV